MFEINLKKTSEKEEEVGQRKLDGKSAKDYMDSFGNSQFTNFRIFQTCAYKLCNA